MQNVRLRTGNESRPFCWEKRDEARGLTTRQARAIAASEHCTPTEYIHPAGDPKTKLTTRAEVETHLDEAEP
ncbi:hypothetical protein [Salinigranum sp. GCM10025319]|uniref:hypothetical protein n=1 Tax=Salinigranum sp. GCM10025319 TaxID=3252687 RepID=UPI0036178A1D